ncbi:MAG: thrombospondin type 3 repeat-containing protein [candidate division Zixibacteria bacterium]|nr:thrombospondin type 3 repeat-containing protein [candidate division Zixibacteria bacterium]
MSKSSFNCQFVRVSSLCLLLILSLVFLIPGSLHAVNQFSIELAETGVGPVDTIIVGNDYEFQVSIENDVLLGGIQLGLEITSPNGATWEWNTQAGGFGPDGPATGGQYVTVVTGSRMDPAGDIWDLSNFLVTERNVDGVSPDTLFPGGVAYLNGLAAGPLQHMFSLHFSAKEEGTPGQIGTICIDSAFVPPVGNMIFADAATGLAIFPDINTPVCYPVKSTCPFDSDGDGFGDPGHIENECPDDNCPTIPNPDQADDDGDGVGDLCDICPGFDDNADADLDGVPDGCDICAGFDDNADADSDGVPDGCDICPGFDDNVDTDTDGVPDGCDICAGYDDNVDTDTDGVPDGCDICPGFDDNVDTDTDGVPDGCDICAGYDDNADADLDGVPDGCDICAGFDDNVDADLDGVPDGCDICAGHDDNADADSDGVPDGCDICPGFNDADDFDEDSVPDSCDNCPEDPNTDQADANGNNVGDVCDFICGDANGDETVNVGDAVYVINYAFKGGPAPDPIESGDANCDDQTNVGDAVYIINYAFKGGPVPCADCP